MILPVSFGVVMNIVTSIVTLKWEHAQYFSYSFPALIGFSKGEKLGVVVDTWNGITIPELLSVAICTVTLSVGAYIFPKSS